MKVIVREEFEVVLDRLVGECEGFARGSVRGLGSVVVHNGLWGPSVHGGTQGYILRHDHDYWVKKCEDYPFNARWIRVWEPTKNGGQAWPIIHREKISLIHVQGTDRWRASMFTPTRDQGQVVVCGDDPLPAAMQCYVISRLGETTELPEELLP